MKQAFEDRFRTEPYTIYHTVVHSDGSISTAFGTGYMFVEWLPWLWRLQGEEDA